MEYAVYYGRRQVGKVQVLRQGLYYKFHCRCHIADERVYRLYVTSAGGRESLGVVVPGEGGFGLDTLVAVKRIGEGALSFSLGVKKDIPEGRFVPIVPEEPFSYIAKLKDAYLERVDGQVGAVIPEGGDTITPAPAPQGSDRSR